MRLKVALLGLIIIGTAFAVRWSVPNLMTLPNYTLYPHIYLTWLWDDSQIKDQFYDDWNCSDYPCFIYYEICENESASICTSTFYSNFSGSKTYSLYYKPEGNYTYRVRARVSESTTGVGGTDVTSFYTDWSNKTSTIVDLFSPSVFAYSDKSKYIFGERVYLTGYALDSGSGVNQTVLSFENYTLINFSRGSSVTFSEIFNPGVYRFSAAAMDKASRGNISSISSFEVLGTSPAIGPPNISVNSIKTTYSNNETVSLTVVANDSGGIRTIDVMVNGTLISECKREFNTYPLYYSYNCSLGPYQNVKNGTYAFYPYNATVTGTSGLSSTTDPDKKFKVVGNSTCSDFGIIVNNGQCTTNGTQSFLCKCGSEGCAVFKKCTDICYCPSGFSCNSTNQVCFLSPGTPTCPDGTPYDYCSGTLPKYCANGVLIDNCSKCGCPSNMNCNTTTGSCYAARSLCGNGLCESGESTICCRDCGCSGGMMCNLTSDTCYLPPGPVVYIKLSLISPKQPDVSLSPGQTVRFVLELKDEYNRLVNNATINVYPITEKYSSSFLGDGQYEVVYQARTNASISFQSYTINMKAKRYLGSEEQFSQPVSLSITLDRFLDIDFITPQQNQSVTESQPIEVKIKYPDGSPVLVGSFDMVFGEKTIPLVLSGETYRAFLNLTNESYGVKNITFIGRDNYNNTLNKILVVYYTYRIDYTLYFVALLLIAGGSSASYFVYKWAKELSKDYKTLKQERTYLETMDKRTHLEYFKRHIDENTFKKLVLEYQQKMVDVDKIIAEMEKRHRWLKWV